MRLSDYQDEVKPDQKKTDPRFRVPGFREKVRVVLGSLGLESNYGNFRKYDGIVDWEATAFNVENPRSRALVKPMIMGKECKCRSHVIELAEGEKLNPEHYKFERWV